jgi:hypothetical protein
MRYFQHKKKHLQRLELEEQNRQALMQTKSEMNPDLASMIARRDKMKDLDSNDTDAPDVDDGRVPPFVHLS